jgi:hypothetical protein
MDPTSFTLDVELDGKPRELIFDIRTFMAWEKVTGQSYMNWVMSLLGGSVRMAREMATEAEAAGMDLDKVRVPAGKLMTMTDFRAILWASCHTPGKRPVWPYTIDEIEELITVSMYMEVAPRILTAVISNMRQPAKKDEAPKPERHTNLSLISNDSIGGTASLPSEGDVLASIEMK